MLKFINHFSYAKYELFPQQMNEYFEQSRGDSAYQIDVWFWLSQ